MPVTSAPSHTPFATVQALMQQSTSPPQYGSSSYSQREFAASSSAVRLSRRTSASIPHSRSELRVQVVAVQGWPPLPPRDRGSRSPPGRTRRPPIDRRHPATQEGVRRSLRSRSAPALPPTPRAVRPRHRVPPASAAPDRSRAARRRCHRPQHESSLAKTLTTRRGLSVNRSTSRAGVKPIWRAIASSAGPPHRTPTPASNSGSQDTTRNSAADGAAIGVPCLRSGNSSAPPLLATPVTAVG